MHLQTPNDCSQLFNDNFSVGGPMVDTSNSTSYFGHWVILWIALYGLQLQQTFIYYFKFHNEGWDLDVEVIEGQSEDFLFLFAIM